MMSSVTKVSSLSRSWARCAAIHSLKTWMFPSWPMRGYGEGRMISLTPQIPPLHPENGRKAPRRGRESNKTVRFLFQPKTIVARLSMGRLGFEYPSIRTAGLEGGGCGGLRMKEAGFLSARRIQAAQRLPGIDSCKGSLLRCTGHRAMLPQTWSILRRNRQVWSWQCRRHL